MLNISSELPPGHDNKNLVNMYASARTSIYTNIKTKICEYSCHKFASNVIEKCIVYGNIQEIEEIVNEMIDSIQVTALLSQ